MLIAEEWRFNVEMMQGDFTSNYLKQRWFSLIFYISSAWFSLTTYNIEPLRRFYQTFSGL